ncbi:hypothetical protein ABID95_000853 [Streptomyces atratus]
MAQPPSCLTDIQVGHQVDRLRTERATVHVMAGKPRSFVTVAPGLRMPLSSNRRALSTGSEVAEQHCCGSQDNQLHDARNTPSQSKESTACDACFRGRHHT